ARHGAHPRGLRSPRSRARARGQSALQLGAARQLGDARREVRLHRRRGDGLFPRLARAMGREDLLADPRFASLALRAEHGEAINAIVADWCRRRTARELAAILERHEVPFGVAYSAADIFADPHIAARGDIVAVDDPVVGPVRMQGVYPRFSRTPGAIRRGAPRLGEHNDEVYRQ